MGNQTGMTALMSAFGRAYHTENARVPVYADPLARRLMTDAEYVAIGGYILGGMDFFAPERKGTFADDADALRYLVNTQIAPTPVGRARFCEECLKSADAAQVVILGAGMDTFGLTHPEADVFEVDHPNTQAEKKRRIAAAELPVSGKLRFVPVDFTRDDLRTALLSAGFDPKKRTLFSWLGVNYYLPKDAIENTLDAIAVLSADGSRLVFDSADEGLFETDVRCVQNMLAMAQAAGEPMRSCFSESELTALLEKHGFRNEITLDSDAVQRTYFVGQDADFTAFEHIRYTCAVYEGREE